jgi:Na+-translocating ferredoxin:NAD+ oxidoreductase subunit D
MQTIKQSAPYIRKDISTNRMMTDVIIALLPVVVFAIYRFGFDALLRLLVSMIVMVIGEAIAFGMIQKPKQLKTRWLRLKSRYQKYTINNVTIPVLSGLIYGLIIPSKLPMYAVIIGALFAIIVVKMIFGGTGNNIFNVAAGGRVFIGLALTAMFTGTYVDIDFVAGATALTSFRGNLGFPYVLESYSLLDLFIGNIPGSMGEISSLAIMIGGIYLLVRRSADYKLMLGSIIPFMIMMLIAGLAIDSSRAFEFMLFQLFAGGILFGAVYMITDPVTAPITGPGRYIYGLLFASLVVLIRLFGGYPEGVVFAILIANIFVSLIDYPTWSKNIMTKNFYIGYGVSFTLIATFIFLGAGGYLG